MPDPEETTLRLFAALELPGAVRRSLSAWATSELSPMERLRLLDEAALHVTLCFLGATPATEVDAIGAACRDAVAGQAPLRLSLGRAVGLPRRRPRVIAVEIGAADGAGLAKLQHAVSERLAAGGWYLPETRPFLAHVTVARVRPRGRIDGRAVERLRAPPAVSFTTDTVTLFRSRTRPDGARYEALTRVELAAG